MAPPWTTIPGATSGIYTLAATTMQDNQRLYRAVATNSVGTVASLAARLTVSPTPSAPVIVTGPAGVTVGEVGTATFNVVADGQPTPTFQWQLSTDGGVTFANINGATASTYVVSSPCGQLGWQALPRRGDQPPRQRRQPRGDTSNT